MRFLLPILFFCGILAANYELNLNIGEYYTQTYGNYIHDNILGERKVDYSNFFASTEFKAKEFDYLNFGIDFLGNIQITGSDSISGANIYKDNIVNDSILYQAYVKFDSDYFKASAGREFIDMQWINNYIEGARFEIGDPHYVSITGIYFDKEGIVDYHSILPFDDNKLGPTFAINISNNLFNSLISNIYFINSNKNINAFNAYGGDFTFYVGNDDLIFDTILKYTYFNSKVNNLNNAQYFEIGQDIKTDDFSAYVGLIKMFTSKYSDVVNITYLSDSNVKNPLSQGPFVYANNALTSYAGFVYHFNDLIDFNAVYGNTSGITRIDGIDSSFPSINEFDLDIGFNLYDHVILDVVYSKVLSNMLDTNNKKYNRDYVEFFITYNFNYFH